MGHSSRLNRPTLTDPCRFGDPTYAKEELVAEMGASYLCGVCGIANATLEHSAAYLQSWMRVLGYDVTLLVQAAAQAQKAADYIQNLSPAVGAEGIHSARSTGMQTTTEPVDVHEAHAAWCALRTRGAVGRGRRADRWPTVAPPRAPR